MYIELSKPDIEKCEDFGRRVVASYAAGKKNKSKALFLPGRPEIHDNWQAQAHGRMAELAFIRLAKLPDECLDWTDSCDGGNDIKLHNLRIDVKSSTHPRAKRLMWPVSKNDFLKDSADVLVFAKVTVEGSSVSAKMVGWAGHHTFCEKATVSSGENNILAGTHYMHQDALNDIRDLFHMITIAAAAHDKERRRNVLAYAFKRASNLA